jgi:filamentous hemagglutinin family protein
MLLPRLLLLLIGGFCPVVLLTTQAIAQSIIPAADGTQTQVNRQGQRSDISGGQRSGNNLFHSFERFGLSRDEVANFQSSPELQNILVRVVGGDTSVIDGLLQMSGGQSHLFLMNPAGILFGQNARLDLPAAFTATTATGIGFENGWFNATGDTNYTNLVGQPTSFAFALEQPGAIANLGTLSVAPGQHLNLLGGNVTNLGQLNAPNGQITVTAVPGSSRVRLSQPGSPLSIEVTPNAEPLNSLSLPALLTGNAQVSGSVSANVIAVVGDRVTLSNATINASHSNGGGTVLIGGGDRGRGTIPNAITTSVNADTTIHADALDFGNGGRVTIWADQSTDFSGNITARGGINGGNGGFVEVSGHEYLAFDGVVNTSATAGESGTILLDPRNVFLTDSSILIVPAIDSIFTTDDLANLTGRVIIEADNNITIDDGFNAIFPADPDNAVIRFVANADASGGGSFSMGAGSQIITNGRKLEIFADSITAQDIDTTEGRATSSGSVVMSAPGNIQVGHINTSNSGTLGGGDVIIRSEGTASPGNVRVRSIDSRSNQGRGGSVELVGSLVEVFDTIPSQSGVSIDASSTSGGVNSGGDVTITHGGGADNIPFSIRPTRLVSGNGTLGRIEAGTGGSSGIGSVGTRDIPVAANGDSTNITSGIRINSVNTPPELTIGSDRQNITLNSNAPISLLVPNDLTASDRNGDNIAFIVADLPSGPRLSRNGVALNNGDRVFPGDILEYRPDSTAKNDGVAFGISAVDFNDGGLSLSRSSNSYRFLFANSTPPITPPVTPPTTPPVTPPITPPEIPPVTPPITSPELTPPLPNTPISSVIQPLDDAESILGTDLTVLEEDASQEFASYFGLEGTQIKSPNQARDLTLSIEQSTGAKPALIYLNFVPTGTGIFTETKPADNDPLEITLVSAKGMIRQQVPGITRSQFNAVAQEFRSQITDPRLTRGKSYLPAAQQLYQWVISPIAEQLKTQKISNLVFIADNGLRSLPFAALHDGNQFLVENYSIGLMPSLSLTNTNYTNIHNSQVLAIGISEGTQGTTPLPAVTTEVSTLMSLWNQRGTTFFNQQATLENLKQTRQATPYGIIHMATHANFVSGATDRSYIQLWNERLQINQIRQLGWNDPPVEMLVLSACQTALGDMQTELGFAGLAVQAGVKTVVASLWYVSDSATTGLMSKFYEQLNTAPIKADALRQAQVAMAKGQVYIQDGHLQGVEGLEAIALPASISNDENFSHPYYWAGFTMVGNPW